MILNYNFVF